MTEDSVLQYAGTLPVDIAFEGYDDTAEWLISGPQYVGVSFDGSHIAFATHRGEEASLFVYTVSSQEMKMVPLASPHLQPVWSATGDTILLRPPYPFLPGWYGEPYPDDYTYELATDTLVQITNTHDRPEIEIRWTADDAIVYSGRNDILYRVNRDGTNLQQLTTSDFDYDSFVDPANLCTLTYLPSNERWYFVEGCAFPEYSKDQIFSVGMTQDIRLEASLPTVLPNHEGIYQQQVFAMNATRSAVLVAVGLGEHLGENNSWYVLRLGPDQPIETIYQINHGMKQVDLLIAEFSADGQSVALGGDEAGGNARLVIGNLNTGETVVEIVGSDWARSICEPRWLDEQTLLYDQAETDCFRYDPQIRRETWVLDTSTGATTNLSTQIGVPVMLLSTPDLTTLPEFSPLAHAGENQTLTDTDDSGSEPVTLDGSGSSDPDGTIVGYS